MENKLTFTEENIQRLFGHEAAEDEDFDRLQSYYIKSKTHDKITADLPLRILVGHKGTGKSALFTIARHEDIENNKLSILIKPDDIADIGKESSDFLQTIRIWKLGLLNIIVSKILATLEIEEGGIIEKIKSKGGKIVSFLAETFEGITQEKKIDLTATKRVVLETFLKEKKVTVYIDDLDRGWQSKKEDIQRISALLNAVRDLVNDNKGLRFRISLRSDVYYLVRTSDESTDKIDSSIIWHSWTNHEILLLLIKRIETYFGRDIDIEGLKNVEQARLAYYLDSVFEKRFTGAGKWANAPTYRILMSLIRKRPRDLVKLCTLAARNAYNQDHDLIMTEDFQSIFEIYSQGRIQDTVNEFKSELPDIERLLLNIKPSKKEIKEGIGFIYDTNRLKQKIRTITERGVFYFANQKKASEDELLQFLYKINFVTARKVTADGEINRKYFEENQHLSSRVTNFGYDWEIHPAFRWSLQPDSISDILFKIDLSADDK